MYELSVPFALAPRVSAGKHLKNCFYCAICVGTLCEGVFQEYTLALPAFASSRVYNVVLYILILNWPE